MRPLTLLHSGNEAQYGSAPVSIAVRITLRGKLRLHSTKDYMVSKKNANACDNLKQLFVKSYHVTSLNITIVIHAKAELSLYLNLSQISVPTLRIHGQCSSDVHCRPAYSIRKNANNIYSLSLV